MGFKNLIIFHPQFFLVLLIENTQLHGEAVSERKLEVLAAAQREGGEALDS